MIFLSGHNETIQHWYEHVLRFNLVHKKEEALGNTRDPLLPDVALDMVVSNINKEDLMNLLAVHPSLAHRLYPINFLEINPSLDSIRLCMVANPNLVKEVKFVNVGMAASGLQTVMREHYWVKFLSSARLKILTIDDITVIRDIELTATLTTVKIEDEITACARDVMCIDMNGINLPKSVTNFRVKAVESRPAPFDFRPPSHNRPPGKLYFDISHHLPSVTSLEMRPCPCREFWDNVNDDFFQNISHLSIHAESGSFFPFSRAKNLKTLVFSGCRHALQFLMDGVTLDALTAFEYRCCSLYPVRWVRRVFMSAAPNLKYLSFRVSFFTCDDGDIHEDLNFLQRVDYFQARCFQLTWVVPFLLSLIPRVKCFDLFCDVKVGIDVSGVRHVDDESVFSLERKVMQYGGRVEIRYDGDCSMDHARFPFLFCRVRVIRDLLFDCENVISDHPFFSHYSSDPAELFLNTWSNV